MLLSLGRGRVNNNNKDIFAILIQNSLISEMCFVLRTKGNARPRLGNLNNEQSTWTLSVIRT